MTQRTESSYKGSVSEGGKFSTFFPKLLQKMQSRRCIRSLDVAESCPA